jgi:hypothetical protein
MSLKDRFKQVADTVRLNDAYRATFHTPDGDLVLRHLMKSFHVYRPTFSSNAAEAAFKEGQRHVVLSILRFICRDPEQLKKQLEEVITDE